MKSTPLGCSSPRQFIPINNDTNSVGEQDSSRTILCADSRRYLGDVDFGTITSIHARRNPFDSLSKFSEGA